MNFPNFFIVGAPKCGTTALSQYLGENTQIFLSSIKEPHFFAKDFLKFRPYYVRTEREYLNLFKGVTGEHLAIGEASVWYLYSTVAIENIYKFNPNAKIIVMLRNPIEVVYSLHSQFLFSMVEDVSYFEQAWRLQNARKVGKHIPKNARKSDHSPKLLQYGQVGKFGEQLKRLFNIFPPEQIKVILFEDFVESTQVVYQETLAFLEVPDDGRIAFPPVNENKFNKVSWVAKLTQYTTESQKIKYFTHRLGLKNTGILRLIGRVNTKQIRRKPLSPVFKYELAEFFFEDIQLLSSLLNRNLDHWIIEFQSQ